MNIQLFLIAFLGAKTGLLKKRPGGGGRVRHHQHTTSIRLCRISVIRRIIPKLSPTITRKCQCFRMVREIRSLIKQPTTTGSIPAYAGKGRSMIARLQAAMLATGECTNMYNMTSSWRPTKPPPRTNAYICLQLYTPSAYTTVYNSMHRLLMLTTTHALTLDTCLQLTTYLRLHTPYARSCSLHPTKRPKRPKRSTPGKTYGLRCPRRSQRRRSHTLTCWQCWTCRKLRTPPRRGLC